MSDWDDKADDHAIAHHTYEHMPPAVNVKLYVGFVLGARWQRGQLRTDEAVERVAEQMFTATQAAYEYMDRTDWNELHKSNQDAYRSDARAAITALLREEL